jgi:hypothetical protein
MAACGKFVSLIRSCYSTKMRFFKDDEFLELPVRWYFTDPAAEWVGFENVFNSRNWYLTDVEEWPTMGEVQGAPRPWADGVGLCAGHPGPFGTALEWSEGSYLVNRIAANPCLAPIGFGFPIRNLKFSPLLQPTVVAIRDGDNWYGPYWATPGEFITYTAQPGAACCQERSAVMNITDGPPAFNVIQACDPTDISLSCLQGTWSDPRFFFTPIDVSGDELHP